MIKDTSKTQRVIKDTGITQKPVDPDAIAKSLGAEPTNITLPSDPAAATQVVAGIMAKGKKKAVKEDEVLVKHS